MKRDYTPARKNLVATTLPLSGSTLILRAVTRIRILCITGVGRTGSTLIDRVLGSAPGVVAVGESRALWVRLRGRNSFCGCGEPQHDCGWWTAALGAAFPGQEIDFDTEIARERRLMSPKSVARLIAGGRWLRPLREDLRAYGELRARLYGAILEQEGARAIVDSTKFPLYALLLARSGKFDVRALHLVRDSRAVGYARTKLRANPKVTDAATTQMRVGVTTMAWRWTAYNALAEVSGRRTAPYLRVRYEDFVAEPARWTARVLAFAGIEASVPGIEAAVVPMARHHVVGSNPVAREASGLVRIVADTAWLREFPRRSKVVTTILTAPGLLQYRYPLRPRQPRP